MRLLFYQTVTVICLVSCVLSTAAQSTTSKTGLYRAIVVLTYDDAIESQLSIAIPQLDSAHLTATFFLTGSAEQAGNIDRWRAAARKGYELANHTYYHPCLTVGAKHSNAYTVKMMVDEIARMDTVLNNIDGKTTRTYAYPCTETAVNGRDYADTLKSSGLVKYARIGGDSLSVITDFGKLDPMRVPSWGVSGNYSGDDLIGFVKKAEQKCGMAIFMFHGIGGDYIVTSSVAHRRLLAYLNAHKETILVTTFQDAMNRVKGAN